MSDVADIRPPARLSALLLGTVMVLAATLAVAVPTALKRDRAAMATKINERAISNASARAAQAARLGLALEDRDLLGEVARELVADDDAVDGLVIELPDGIRVEAGAVDKQSLPDVLVHTRAVEGIAPAADLLWLGDWPMLKTASAPLALGQITVYGRDPGGVLAISRGVPTLAPVVWISLCAGVLMALGAALHVRVRLLRLGRSAAEIASGNLDERAIVGGRDEVAWVARSLAEIQHYMREQVHRVHGRNATLLAHVTVQGDRLERIAHFASRLVAPVADSDAFDPVLEALGEQLDAPLVLLFRPDANQAALSCTAARGVEARAIDTLDPAGPPWRAALDSDQPVTMPPLSPTDSWLATAGRRVPLRGVAVMPVRFHGRLEAMVVVARRDPMSEPDLDFLIDASRPLAIALANRAAYRASVELSEALEQRNAVLIEQRDQLRVVNRLRSQFTANMSHELRTPLNAIIGYGELLADGLYGPINEAQRGALDGVEQAGRSLLTLVNQVLDLSSAEVGQLSVEFGPADLREVIDEALLIARPLARARPYDLRASGDAISLVTDAQRVLQIVTNLLNNAIKFTDHGQVCVELRRANDGGAEVVVTDTGIGIAPEELDLVFEEFRQVDQSSTRAHDGVGLGLAISRRLAELLGGSLTAVSEPGRGSAFTLRLPARPPLEVFPSTPHGEPGALAA